MGVQQLPQQVPPTLEWLFPGVLDNGRLAHASLAPAEGLGVCRGNALHSVLRAVRVQLRAGVEEVEAVARLRLDSGVDVLDHGRDSELGHVAGGLACSGP